MIKKIVDNGSSVSSRLLLFKFPSPNPWKYKCSTHLLLLGHSSKLFLSLHILFLFIPCNSSFGSFHSQTFPVYCATPVHSVTVFPGYLDRYKISHGHDRTRLVETMNPYLKSPFSSPTLLIPLHKTVCTSSLTHY